MLTFTDRAREMVGVFLEDAEGEPQALRITMEGSPTAPRWELTLVGAEERVADEWEVDLGEFKVLIPEAAADLLRDATVDFVERVHESGFEVRVAGSEAADAGGGGAAAGAPSGPIADRVRAVLESQVNPAIAAHGGMISLAEVQGTEIYLEMSGGCQGCALSRMTLRQGVERMLRQSVPELTAVHDVTDHASGENPYFEKVGAT